MTRDLCTVLESKNARVQRALSALHGARAGGTGCTRARTREGDGAE